MTEYYTLGRTGLRVSRLSLGAMTFGTASGWGADKATSRAMFDCYLQSGGNFIDTADIYTAGTSETWLGEFIGESGTRDRVVLATKFTGSGEPGNPNAAGNGRKNMMRAVDASLRRLQTDYIDLYIMHMWDMVTPAEEVMRGFDDLVRAGKIRHAGLSDVPGWYAGRAQTLAELRGYEPISSIQLQYSLLERNIEHEFTSFANHLACGITAWSPLAGGILSGKYRTSRTDTRVEGRISVMGKDNPFFNKGWTDADISVVAELERVAGELGRSMAQVAINWVANRPGIASVIVGASKLAQLQDALQSLEFRLPEELAARLEVVSRRPTPFPYTFFEPKIHPLTQVNVRVGQRPETYDLPVHTTD
jgi:aryl-alcohol dehydrogenase-like predicted oxidoreductase